MSFNKEVSALIAEATSPQAALLDHTRGLVSKWERSGLLEGMENPYEKGGMALMLENQARQLLDESTTTTFTAGGEQWAGVALPLVRKVFGEIAAKEFVSVQPMNLPAGLIFYVDFRYGTTINGRTNQQSMYGDTTSSTAPNGGLYGAGQFGYTINDAIASGLTSLTSSLCASSSVNFSGINIGALYDFEVPFTNFTNQDPSSIRGWTLSGSITGLLREYTRLNATQTAVIFVANSGSIGGAASAIQGVNYLVQPTDSSRGDFEDRSGTDIGIPEVDLQLYSIPIVSKTRKLKAIWTPELAQDLNAYHSVDAEQELTSMLSEYISLEIDLEILDMLQVNAVTTDFWSTTIGNVYDKNASAFVQSAFYGTAWTNQSWYQTLGQKIQRVSNRIHQLTMRGGANFVVASPDVCTLLETIPGFVVDTNGDKMKYAMGVSQIGSYQNRFTVYKNPYMTQNVILMGFRGSNFLETGAVYAPYVPLIMTPLVYDPTNFTPRRGVLTRYAKKMVRPEFFGKIVIQGINNI